MSMICTCLLIGSVHIRVCSAHVRVCSVPVYEYVLVPLPWHDVAGVVCSQGHGGLQGDGQGPAVHLRQGFGRKVSARYWPGVSVVLSCLSSVVLVFLECDTLCVVH